MILARYKKRIELRILVSIALVFTNIHAIESANVSNNRTLVIIRASYAQGWEVEEFAGFQVVNVGIGGEESNELLERFSRDVIDRNPAIVVI